MRTLISAVSLCLLLGEAAAGAPPAAEQEPVVITGLRNPDIRSYRAVVAGLDAFEQNHRMAPLAPEVRFRMRASEPSAGLAEPLALRIVGDDDSAPIALPIDADGVFRVPRIQAAYDARADLVLNQRKDKFRAKAEVRTPGLPDNVRRLGDMRLECRVRVAIGKYEAPFWMIALANTFFMTGDWCGHGKISWPIVSAAPLAGATLADGERSVALELHGKQYMAPIGDQSWPDDTLIELRLAN